MPIIGPVNSRRLGRSLGIYPVPQSLCPFHCIYCPNQSPRTTRTGREEFYPLGTLLEEVERIPEVSQCDYLTVLGDGEPSLYWYLGSLLRRLKRRFGIPTAVFTNGALLYRREVRQDLEAADRIFVKLDASDNKTFQKINNPHESIYFNLLVDGISRLVEEQGDKVVLEFNLLRGWNDSPEHLQSMAQLIKQLKITKLYIKSPICPPAVYRAGLYLQTDPARVQKTLGGGEILPPKELFEIDPGRYGDFDTAAYEILSRMVLPLAEVERIAACFGIRDNLTERLERAEFEQFRQGDITWLRMISPARNIIPQE